MQNEKTTQCGVCFMDKDSGLFRIPVPLRMLKPADSATRLQSAGNNNYSGLPAPSDWPTKALTKLSSKHDSFGCLLDISNRSTAPSSPVPKEPNHNGHISLVYPIRVFCSPGNST